MSRVATRKVAHRRFSKQSTDEDWRLLSCDSVLEYLYRIQGQAGKSVLFLDCLILNMKTLRSFRNVGNNSNATSHRRRLIIFTSVSIIASNLVYLTGGFPPKTLDLDACESHPNFGAWYLRTRNASWRARELVRWKRRNRHLIWRS